MPIDPRGQTYAGTPQGIAQQLADVRRRVEQVARHHGALGANAITGTQIGPGSIGADQIVTGSITAGQIMAGTITAGLIAANAITATAIAAGSINAGHIQ